MRFSSRGATLQLTIVRFVPPARQGRLSRNDNQIKKFYSGLGYGVEMSEVSGFLYQEKKQNAAGMKGLK